MSTSTPCRHLHTDGRQCGSPALRGEPLCFHHSASRRPLPLQKIEGAFIPSLPAPDDHLAIQRGIAEVLRLLATDQIADRRATTLFRGLALASANLTRAHRREEKLAALGLLTPPVTELAHDPQHGTLAPVPSTATEPETERPAVQTPESLTTQSPVPAEPPAAPLPASTPFLIPAPPEEDLNRYDTALACEIHTKLAYSFRLDRQRFEAEKTAELEAQFEARFEARFEAQLKAQRTALDAPTRLPLQIEARLQTRSPLQLAAPPTEPNRTQSIPVQQNQEHSPSSQTSIPEPDDLALAS